MDLKGTTTETNNKRGSSVEDDHNSEPKRTCPSLPSGVEAGGCVTEIEEVDENILSEFWTQIGPSIQQEVVERFFADSWPQIEPLFQQVIARFFTESRPQIQALIQQRFFQQFWPRYQHLFRQTVHKEVNITIPPRVHSLLQLPRQKEVGDMSRSGISKFKLCFCNQIASIIFTNNEIRAETGEQLQVAIYDTTNFNAIICTGPLSTAQIEFVVLDGEFDTGQQQEETTWTLTDFNKSVLSPRDGKRPLIIGNDLKLYLKNGVGLIKSLIITDNSSWIKSKKFRLGVRVKDEKILAEFSRIGEAVSQPFRVMDQRGEVYKKHHPPSREDEVWRLEGIGKDGTYHNNLSSQGIKTVGDFLTVYYEKGPAYLKMLIGKRVLDKTWKMMINNALECGSIPTYDQSFEPNLVGNLVMEGEAFNENFEYEQKNLGYSDEQLHGIIHYHEELDIEVPRPSILAHEETSTSNDHVGYIETHTQCYQGP